MVRFLNAASPRASEHPQAMFVSVDALAARAQQAGMGPRTGYLGTLPNIIPRCAASASNV